jgi:Zn-dependent metalloprotease/PKD repeat protein
MNQYLTIFLVFTGFFGAASFSAQELTGKAAEQRIPGAVRIRLEANGAEPTFVIFDESKTVGLKEITVLQQHVFGRRPEDTWKWVRSEDDRIGTTHVRYQQQYRQIDVEGQVYIFHAKGEKIVSANGHFLPNIQLSTTPAITQEKALLLAAAGMKQPLALEQAEQTEVQLVVLPLGRKPVLAYKCILFSRKPLVNQIVYVDAQNGKILREASQICSNDVPGTAVTHFSGIQPIVADQVGNGFLLRESGRGNGIETYNHEMLQLYPDADNHWNNVNATMDEFAGDVHFGMEATYDFFHDYFGRNSYDNNGGVIRSYVNEMSVEVNAYWSGGFDNTMHYGPGNSNYFPVTSLEIAGHELSHGVTEYSAGLQYLEQSGALNESFSDIFGATIRFLEAPSVATWFIGDQLLRPGGSGEMAFRNMSDPNQFFCPDTYGGLYFNAGDIVHYDSGIQNFWYYLLVEGGTGTNDIGHAYQVTGIGLEDALQITYRNLAYYLTPTSTFEDARYGAEQAAADLFGMCSQQQLQTINAWYAVGVGGSELLFQPTASYTVSNNFACEGPLGTQFFGGGDYSSYHWDFGDGNTSSLQNPTHLYENTGHYPITLIVSNEGGCIFPDTLIVPNGIVVDEIDPVAAFTTAGAVAAHSPFTFIDQSLYGPISWEWDFGNGDTSTLMNPMHMYADSGTYTVTLIVHNCHGSDTLTKVIEVMQHYVLCADAIVDSPSGVIFDPGGPDGDYLPSGGVCELVIRPCNASLITLTIDAFSMSESDGLVILDGVQWVETFTGNVSPITLTTTSGVFYLQYIADEIPDGLPGFQISYTSELAVTDENSTDAYISPFMSYVGQVVNFYNSSEYSGVGWFWDFGDGSFSYDENPQYTYQEPGTYPVTLTVTYCDGSTDKDSVSYFVCCGEGGVGMQELSTGKLLKVYPNPSNGVLTLSAETILTGVAMHIYDLSGREIYYQELDQVLPKGITIDIGTLSNGQYVLETLYEFNGSVILERNRIQVQH